MPQTLLEQLAVASLTAMMADLEQYTLVVHQSVLLKVRATAIALLSRGLFLDSEKMGGRALRPFVASP